MSSASGRGAVQTNQHSFQTFTTLRLKPKQLLKANTVYRLKWPAGARVLSKLDAVRFTTGASTAKAIKTPPVVKEVDFWENKRGCGEHRYFWLRIVGPGLTGLYHLQLARKKAHLVVPAGKRSRLVAEFIDALPPGGITVGSGGCGGNYKFRLRQRVWGRVRIIGASGKPGPWSAPFELVADPSRPGTRRTCPPQL